MRTIASIEIRNGKKMPPLKDSIEKKCRFCKKSAPDVSFENKAHAIPRFLGNETLLSKYECDACNILFGRYENEMANLMQPWHTLFGVKGRKGIPKYELTGEPIIENKDNVIDISDVDLFTILNYKNGVPNPLEIKTPSYTPYDVFRCLIKTGLSIIPENKLPNYERTIEWLIKDESNSDITPFMLLYFYPSMKLEGINCVVSESTRGNPCSFLSISYARFTIQACFPHFKEGCKDKFDVWIRPSALYKNLSYKGKVKGEPLPFMVSGKGRLRLIKTKDDSAP